MEEGKENGYMSHFFHFTANKAGMNGLDREKVNKIIFEASKDSNYFKNEQRKDEISKAKIAALKKEISEMPAAVLNSYSKAAEKHFEECEKMRDLSRTWIVVDMDMFFAAVEMRDDPSLQDKAVAVGGMSMISTANYKARQFGVRAAMPGFIAKQLCPDLVFVNSHYDKYTLAAEQTREIFQDYDPEFEAMSLDEAYLDVTQYLSEHRELTSVEVAEEIRARIFEKTRLTCSCGIAPNRMLAKMCSDVNKPNGLFLLAPVRQDILSFLEPLAVRKIPGVGRISEMYLNAFNIFTVAELRAQAGLLYLIFPASTPYGLLNSCVGLSANEHEESTVLANRKSMSCDRTFSPITTYSEVMKKFMNISASLAKDLQEAHLRSKNISVKVKLCSFITKQKQTTLDKFVDNENDIFLCAGKLFKACFNSTEIIDGKYPPIRLLGIRVSSFDKNQFEKPSKNQTTIDQYTNKSTSTNDVLVIDSQEDDVILVDHIYKDPNEEETIEEEVIDSSCEIVDCDDVSGGDFNIQGIDVIDLNTQVFSSTHKSDQISFCPICDTELKMSENQVNQHVKICLEYKNRKQTRKNNQTVDTLKKDSIHEKENAFVSKKKSASSNKVMKTRSKSDKSTEKPLSEKYSHDVRKYFAIKFQDEI